MKPATAPHGLLRQHLDHKGIRAGLVPVHNPAGRLAIDDPVLQQPAPRRRQGVKALPDPVQIGGHPAIADRKPVLDPGAQPLGKHRRIPACRHRQDHRVPIDNRSEIEAAQRGLVRHIHRHADPAGLSRQGFIKRPVSCLDHDKRAAGEMAASPFRGHAGHVAHAGNAEPRRHPVLKGDHVNQRREVPQQAQLGRQRRVGAHDKRWRSAKVDEDRKMPCH